MHFFLTKFNLKTPGREDDDADETKVREKRSRQRAAARRIQKRQEALLLQYVLESEERTKEMPDVLKLPEFMVNRERRNKHAY